MEELNVFPFPLTLKILHHISALSELGFDAKIELWNGQMRQEPNLELEAHYSRIRLCLPESREGEVMDFLKQSPKVKIRELAAIWWDVRK